MVEKKEEKKKPEKIYYTVEIQAMVPATIKYRVFAETPEEALQLVKNATAPYEKPAYKLSSLKRLSAKVFLWGTCQLKLKKNF